MLGTVGIVLKEFAKSFNGLVPMLGGILIGGCDERIVRFVGLGLRNHWANKHTAYRSQQQKPYGSIQHPCTPLPNGNALMHAKRERAPATFVGKPIATTSCIA